MYVTQMVKLCLAYTCMWFNIGWSIWPVQEKVPVKGGRGAVNLLVKCKMCSRENSLGQ